MTSASFLDQPEGHARAATGFVLPSFLCLFVVDVVEKRFGHATIVAIAFILLLPRFFANRLVFSKRLERTSAAIALTIFGGLGPFSTSNFMDVITIVAPGAMLILAPVILGYRLPLTSYCRVRVGKSPAAFAPQTLANNAL